VPKRSVVVRLVLLSGAVGGAAALVVLIGAPDAAVLREWGDRSGAAGPPLTIVATALLLLVLVPRSALAAGAGALFGPLPAIGYVVIGACLAAVAAYAAGRWAGRDAIALSQRWRRVDAWLLSSGVTTTMALRFLPIAPFGLVSYVLGATAVRLGPYLTGTILGILPSTTVYAILGANAMRPGSAAFGWSLAAALLLVATSGAVTAATRRRIGSARNRPPRADVARSPDSSAEGPAAE
jgi:uncharacterized membrane protein YdjX (TVP38/TMEM64 family)